MGSKPEKAFKYASKTTLSFMSRNTALRLYLPTLSDFKALLKTSLFQQAFPDMLADYGVCVCVCVCVCVYAACLSVRAYVSASVMRTSLIGISRACTPYTVSPTRTYRLMTTVICSILKWAGVRAIVISYVSTGLQCPRTLILYAVSYLFLYPWIIVSDRTVTKIQQRKEIKEITLHRPSPCVECTNPQCSVSFVIGRWFCHSDCGGFSSDARVLRD